ncbi:MAG: flavodoxin family protein [Sedimentisphaerales bacterium]|nr:flavodoxin family protein [Sedimentisphaerales bacterium]
MKILGISGSPRAPETSGVYKLVKIVLEATGQNYELISLRGKEIGGCIACLGCVKDNICKVRDDMADLRDKIVEADAYVIGAPNYYMGINALTRGLLERLYQFRHQTGNTLWGRLAVAVGIGGSSGQASCDDIERFMGYNFIETIAKVSGQGAASCYSCGYGETCQVGIPVMIHGQDVKITDDMIPDVAKQPEVIDAAKRAGELLGQRLSNNYDRWQVAEKMQEIMMEKFKSST